MRTTYYTDCAFAMADLGGGARAPPYICRTPFFCIYGLTQSFALSALIWAAAPPPFKKILDLPLIRLSSPDSCARPLNKIVCPSQIFCTLCSLILPCLPTMSLLGLHTWCSVKWVVPTYHLALDMLSSETNLCTVGWNMPYRPVMSTEPPSNTVQRVYRL